MFGNFDREGGSSRKYGGGKRGDRMLERDRGFDRHDRWSRNAFALSADADGMLDMLPGEGHGAEKQVAYKDFHKQFTDDFDLRDLK